MRKMVLAIAAAVSCGVCVIAAVAADAPPGSKNADDPLAGYYGNTLLSMNQPHYVIRTWFYPNGAFKEFKATHEGNDLEIHGWEGTYKIQGKPGALQVCKTYDSSPAPPPPACDDIALHKAGDVWRVTYKTGQFKGTTETFTVAVGHDTEP